MFRKIPIHPVLFAVYPILFLYTNNISMLEIKHIFMPIFWSVCGTLILWGLVNLFIKNNYKSSAIVSLLVILFFSYGHLIDALKRFPERIIGISSDLYISLNFIIIAFITIYLIIKYHKKYLPVSGFLNFLGLLLLVYPVFITLTYYEKIKIRNTNPERNLSFSLAKTQSFSELTRPDIYYIVLDGYARGDVLEKVYGYDNENFYRELEHRGFFIARKSRANYIQTLPSLSSTLNMNYIDSLDAIKVTDYTFRSFLRSKIASSDVSEFLSDFGYKFVTFATGYSETEIQHSDFYLTPEFSLDEFKFMVISSTPLYKLLQYIPDKSPKFIHRQRILYPINTIPDFDLHNDPIFLFAHIIAPHPPFVLDRGNFFKEAQTTQRLNFYDGSHYHSFNDSLQQDYKLKYIIQLTELNRLIIGMIDKIMYKKKDDIIIILQSDHGPGLWLHWERPNAKSFFERSSILNAYYFPKGDVVVENDSITPVNTFRVLFNHYFNSNYEMLENKSYFSTWTNPTRFFEVNISDEN